MGKKQTNNQQNHTTTTTKHTQNPNQSKQNKAKTQNKKNKPEFFRQAAFALEDGKESMQIQQDSWKAFFFSSFISFI